MKDKKWKLEYGDGKQKDINAKLAKKTQGPQSFYNSFAILASSALKVLLLQSN
jgi:hypothetical protein